MALRAACSRRCGWFEQLLRQESGGTYLLALRRQAATRGCAQAAAYVLGRAEMQRAYYWCSRCSKGNSPPTRRWMWRTPSSRRGRRMLTVVGSECSSFERGREQMKLLAGLEVTTKAVERTTESIGADIASASRAPSNKPATGVAHRGGQAIPVMYVQMDGTACPW